MRILDVSELPAHMRADAQLQLNGHAPSVVVKREAKIGSWPAAANLPKKPSKYRNVKVTIEGETYDSKLEYQQHEELRRLQRLGDIGLILRQVPFRLEGGVVYRADFLVELLRGGPPFIEVWDAKGKDTQASINKRKQVLARYGIEVKLWRRAKG